MKEGLFIYKSGIYIPYTGQVVPNGARLIELELDLIYSARCAQR